MYVVSGERVGPSMHESFAPMLESLIAVSEKEGSDCIVHVSYHLLLGDDANDPVSTRTLFHERIKPSRTHNARFYVAHMVVCVHSSS